MKIILGSNSPRRRELLAGLGVDFQVHVIPDIDESYPDSLGMTEIPLFISKKKSMAYSLDEGELLITADTIVWAQGQVLGKPHTPEESRKMLQLLSGRKHQVVTGVILRTVAKKKSFSSVTDVMFAPLSPQEITYYVDRFKPFDKAGSYGIQEWIGYVGVTHISGSYFNVMGLPVQRLYTELKKEFPEALSPLFEKQ